MSTVWFQGVPWLDRALDAAQRKGIAEQVNAIAADFRKGVGTYVTHGDPAGRDRLRVIREGYGAVIAGEAGIVIGYLEVGPLSEVVPEATPVSRKRRKAQMRGPASFEEMLAWLADDGFTSRITGGGHVQVLFPDGRVAVTMPSTPSDHRSLSNTIAQVRRTTGLPLRRSS